MRLILVRHPKPLCEPGLCYGRLDLPCNPVALERAVSSLIPVARGCRMISSPAKRALDLAQRLSAEVEVEPRLQELHFGLWEGRRWSEFGRKAIDDWRRGLPDASPPEGETLTSLAARCREWLSSLETQKPILAITHAGPIRIIRSLVENTSLLAYFETNIAYAEPIILDLGSQFFVKKTSTQDSNSKLR